MTVGLAWEIYQVAATLAVRRFVAKYRNHMFMLGVLIFMVLSAMGALIRIAVASADDGGTGEVGQGLTPGSVAVAAFVLLLVRGLVDVHRSVLRDRALWSVLVSPASEGRVRAGLVLRTAVFQLGLLALVMGTFALVLSAAPEKPRVPWETAPLVVLAGLAAGVLPLPLLLSAMDRKVRAHQGALVLLLVTAGAFVAALQLELAPWAMLSAGAAVVAVSLAVTLRGPRGLSTVWGAMEGARYRPSRVSRTVPPLFSLLQARLDPVGRALFRREMVLGYPGRQRAAFAGLNVAMGLALITLNQEMSDLLTGTELEVSFNDLITPVMVGMGIYAVAFFQATMPLVDGVTKEGNAIWVLRTSPVEPKRFLAAKALPLVAFLPLTVMAVGVGIPLAAGRGAAAIAVGALGSVGVYLAFLGVGAWAGATYPNLDRHSNAPPDLVLAFYLMFGCLVLEAVMLFPVMAMALIDPVLGVVGAGFSVALGAIVLWLGLELGGRSLGQLEVA